MKKAGLLLAGLLAAAGTQAQHERSVFSATGRAGVSTSFVTDYQAIGINPANLGMPPKYEDRYISFGIGEWAHSIYSEALTKTDLRQSILNFDSDEFTYDQQVKAAKSFVDAGLSMNADIGILAVGVNTKKLGGFAFSVNERFQWYSKFNETTSDILFRGYNADYFIQKIMSNGDTLLPSDPNFNPDSVIKGIATVPLMFSQLMDGTTITMSWRREYNFSYGLKLVSIMSGEGEDKTEKIALYAGAGVKYLSGMAIVDIGAEGGKFHAMSAITPAIPVEYGKAGDMNPSTVKGDGLPPKSVGSGLGFDFGVTLALNNKLKASAAITDMGSMTWNGNVYEAHDTLLIDSKSAGFKSYNIFSEATELMGDSGIFTWGGVVEIKEKLPTIFRLGGSFALSEKFEIGLDAVAPVNDASGNLEKPLIAIGGDVQPLPWLRASTGFVTGGNYGFNIPLGLTVIMGEGGTWEMGVATRDVMTYISQNKPTLSFAFGLLRFRV